MQMFLSGLFHVKIYSDLSLVVVLSTMQAKYALQHAPKMAITDGLTKALSHLGFNADVSLGEMDGNKYAGDSGDEDTGGW